MNLVASTLRNGAPGEPRQAARDLGLADAGRPDHQDVLGQHLLAQLVVELQPPPAVAQRDRDRALGVVLADDEAVELGDDLAGGEVGHGLRPQQAGPRACPHLLAKPAYLIGPDRAAIVGIRIGDHARHPGGK